MAERVDADGVPEPQVGPGGPPAEGEREGVPADGADPGPADPDGGGAVVAAREEDVPRHLVPLHWPEGVPGAGQEPDLLPFPRQPPVS